MLRYRFNTGPGYTYKSTKKDKRGRENPLHVQQRLVLAPIRGMHTIYWSIVCMPQ